MLYFLNYYTGSHRRGATTMALHKKIDIPYLLAVLLCLGIWLSGIESLRYLIYPLQMLATWSHEMGHGITTLLLGGEFRAVSLYFNGSGVAEVINHGRISHALSCAGGLLGPVFAGWLLLFIARDEARGALVLRILAISLLLSLLIWVRNGAGVILSLTLSLLLAGGSMMKGVSLLFTARLCAAQLLLSPLQNWRYLFSAEAEVGGKLIRSDVGQIADAFILFPAFVWGAIIGAISLSLFIGSLRSVQIKRQ